MATLNHSISIRNGTSESKNEYVYEAFMNGYRIVHRTSNSFLVFRQIWQQNKQGWATVRETVSNHWTTIVLQIKSNSEKSHTGGIHRRKGQADNQRSIWVASWPAYAIVINLLQSFAGVTFNNSTQHQDISKSRVKRDEQDIKLLLNFLKESSPLVGESKTLRSIAVCFESLQRRRQ